MARSPVERSQKLALLKRMRELVRANIGNVYNPEDSYMLLGRACVLEAQGQKPEEAMGLLEAAYHHFRKAIELDPGMTCAYDALIELLSAVGNEEGAQEIREKKEEINGS